jgi:NDP-sugar pyrophosphorylase family protein
MSIQAVLLLGGQGTRLRSLFPDRPKALVPVGGRPFIEHQLEWLRRGGVNDVHLAAGYRADDIASWLQTACATFSNMTITMSREPRPLGTAGALKFVEYYLRTDPVLVVNGDTLAPRLDFQTLDKCEAIFPDIGNSEEVFFQSLENWRAFLVVAPIEQSGRYGTVEFDARGLVTAFREKSQREAGWVNAGVYLLPRRVLSLIPEGQEISLERHIFPRLVSERRLYVVKADPPLLDMGTPEGLETMERWLRANAP